MKRILGKLWHLISTFFDSSYTENFIPIMAKPDLDQDRCASPELIRVSEELGLGADRERLVEMAVRNHITEANQIKWLKAIPTLRRGKTQWILDKNIPKHLVPSY